MHSVVTAERPKIFDARDLHIEAALGEGDFGTVFKAWLLFLHKDVFIKRKRLDPAGLADLKDLLAHASAPPHSNTLRFLGVAPEADTFLFVVDAVAGGTSTLEFVNQSSVAADALHTPPARIARLLCDVLSALVHLHACEIVHCNVDARMNLVLVLADL